MDFVVDEEAHERLLKSVAFLGKGKKKKKSIKKPVNEERTIETGLSYEELVGSLDPEKNLGTLKTQLTVSQKRSNVLAAPLHRQQQEKILRGIAYTETKKDLGKWNSVVRQNRVVDQLKFPLEQEKVEIKPISASGTFVPRTKLELESARILGKSKHNLTNEQEFTEAEKEMMKALSLKEIKQKTAEIQKMRHLMSYQEAKFKRQKNIKSKRYHRLMKRQKRKQILKEFEELKDKDPEAAKERLELLEKDRIMERAVLKHRGTGQWAKQLRLHARHDEKTKTALAEQLKLGRELKEKQLAGDSDEEASASKAPQVEQKKRSLEDIISRMEDDIVTEGDNLDNPWMIPNKIAKLRKNKQTEASQTVVVEGEQKKKKRNRIEQNVPEEKATTSEQKDSPVEDKPKKKRKLSKSADKDRVDNETKNTSKATVIDDLFDGLSSKLMQTVDSDETKFEKVKKKRKEKPPPKAGKAKNEQPKKPDEELMDPEKFMIRSELDSQILPNLAENFGNEGDEDRNEFLAEAFEDDNVVAEFEKEKKALEEEEAPKDIDLSLPGWGEWAGAGLEEAAKRKRKRFLIKAKPAPPRKDRMLPGVIISEKEDTTIRKLQVSSLPFPFSCVEDFESAIRHPLGPEWNTELGHKSLTEPSILSRKGQIIRPMDKSVLIKQNQDEDSDNMEI